jgi:endonuclease/exonuclease/phosphatase family metal-dependent hydrolase
MTFTAYHRLIDQLRTAVRAERLPTLVVGDLNMVDRTSSYRAMGHDLSDAMRADWVGPTSRRAPIVPLLARIDQIFMPKTWCSTDSATFTLSASDHQGIVVTLGPC